MKIVKILGGLGNQMFQYAFFMTMKKAFPDEPVTIDLSCFHGYPLHNGFELNRIFSLNYTKASFSDIAKVAYPYSNYRLWQIGKYILPKRKSMYIENDHLIYDKSVFKSSKYEYFDGYWQNLNYFSTIEENIKKTFIFRPFEDSENLKNKKIIQEKQSASIHIRRGDYLKNSIYQNICNIEYYQKALQILRDRTSTDVFFVFSDNEEWCKFNIFPLLEHKKVIFIDYNRGIYSYRDMQLMSLCNHNIIANSSFSWWAAWLNSHSDKTVIAPRKWINRETTSMQFPKEWIVI